MVCLQITGFPLSTFFPFVLAGTYVLASNLPSFILDGLINLPHFLVSVRNGLLPVTPARIIPADQLPPPVTQQQQNTVAVTHEVSIPHSPVHEKVGSVAAVTTEVQDEELNSGDEKQSDPGSNDDADVESNIGAPSVVESSWVNLHEKHD